MGVVESTLGAVIVLAGTGLGSLSGIPNVIPIGLAMAILGVLLCVAGLGRATAQMEVSGTHVTWTWSFAKHRLALEDLVDAALVEKGSPAPEGEWAGFLGGGFRAVFAWWLLDATWAIFNSEPSLDTLELVAIKRYGGPISIKPIGAWSTHSSHSEANRALQCLQTSIASSARRPPVAPTILRTDAWEQRWER